MNRGVQNFILYLGSIWTIGWFILLLFQYIAIWPSFLYELPGLILLIIGLYDWDFGEDMRHKQDVPIENDQLDFSAR